MKPCQKDLAEKEICTIIFLIGTSPERALRIEDLRKDVPVLTVHRPTWDDFTEERPGRGRPPRLFLAFCLLLIAAGITLLARRPDFFATDHAEAAARFSARAASSAASASESVSPAPSSAAAPSSAPSSLPAQSEAAAEIPLAEAVRPLSVRVSLAKQQVAVFDAKGRAVKLFVCSSGKTGSETPRGTFTVSDRGKSFYNPDLKEGAYYWTRFYGTYLFHSVPFDKNYRMEPEEADKLGEPASHGCIRLPVEDAKWIYDNIPKGTKVVIA